MHGGGGGGGVNKEEGIGGSEEKEIWKSLRYIIIRLETHSIRVYESL